MNVTVTAAGAVDCSVSDRQLFAVQTLEIGRLSGDVVPLAPGAFIPVSGEGDRSDSNGSGKTTFLAAVALLLGDPQWRLGNATGDELVNLLFDPNAAGAAGRGYSQATHGYVVGAFERDSDTRTVWIRINRERRRTDGPLQVRIYEGLRLVVADNDTERLAAADAAWQSGEHLAEMGLRNYARALYGESPRVAAYVGTRGGRGSGPSLLAAEVGQFDEEQIGAELLRLSGQEELLRHDEQQRQERALTRRQLLDARREHELAVAREDAELSNLNALDAARAAVGRAQSAWDDHFACLLAETLDALAVNDSQIAQAKTRLLEAAVARAERQRAVEEMPDARQLRDRIAQVAEDLDEAREASLAAGDYVRQLSDSVANLTQALRTARRQSAGWRGTSVTAARDAHDEQVERARIAGAQAAGAQQQLARAQAQLAAVKESGRPRAAQAVSVLREAGVQAVGLLDATVLSPDLVARIEPALWPWRDAVVVGLSDRQRAAEALGELPGALVICGEPTALPEGVQAPPAAAGFLTRLLSAHPVPGGVTGAPDQDVLIVAPLAGPITGRQAAVDAAGRAVDDAADAHRTAQRVHEDAERALRTCADELARACAAKEADNLQAALSQAGENHSGAERQLRTTRLAEAALLNELRSHERQVGDLQSRRALADNALAEARAEQDLALSGLRELEASARERRRAVEANPYYEQQDEAKEHAARLGRDESTLRKDAHDALTAALGHLRIDSSTGEGARQHDEAIGQVVARRRSMLESGRPPLTFAELAAPLQLYLGARAQRDREVRGRLERHRDKRVRQISALEAGLLRQDEELGHLAESIESSVRTVLGQLSQRYDALDRASGGHGAGLSVDLTAPGDDESWSVRVEPKWARGAGEGPVSYRRPGNTAMKKQRTINLVLAALLGSGGHDGAQVLILDELGDSLGQQHRLSVLSAIAQTAAEAGITVLATCQDSMLEAAGRFARQTVYFRFFGGLEVVNRPPVLYGYDEGRRVRMTAEALLAGRPLA